MEALLGPIRYERAIVAAGDVRLLYIPGESLRRLMAVDQNFGWRLLFSLGEQQSKQIHALTTAVMRLRSDAHSSGVATSDSAMPYSANGLFGAGKLSMDALPPFLSGESSQEPAVADVPANVSEAVSVGIGDRTTTPRRKGQTGRGLNPK